MAKSKDWYVVWTGTEFLAIENKAHGRTPETIMGHKLVVAGQFTKPVDAIDYAKNLLAAGRLRL